LALAVCMLSLLGFPAPPASSGMVHPDRGHGIGAGLARRAARPHQRRIGGLLSPGDHGDVQKPEPSPDAHGGVRLGWLAGAALGVSVAALLWFGVRPNRLLDASEASAKTVHAAPPAATGPSTPTQWFGRTA